MKKTYDGYSIEFGDNWSGRQPLSSRQHDSEVIVTTFKNSWGEIDSFLPILFSIKKIAPAYQIVSIIETDRMMLPEFIVPVLMRKLREVSDVFVYPETNRDNQKKAESTATSHPSVLGNFSFMLMRLRRIIREYIQAIDLVWAPYQFIQNRKQSKKWGFLFSDIIYPDSVRVLLQDHTVESKLQRYIAGECKNVRIVLHPHATSLYINLYIKSQEKIINKRADVLLLPSSLGMKWAKEKYPRVADFQITGFARYDRWWINMLLHDEDYINSREYNAARKKKTVVSFFTHDIDPVFLPEKLFRYLIKSVCLIASEYKDSLLIVKPHPRQDIAMLKSLLSDYPSVRWMLTNLQATQVCALSTFVVAMWSSTILDALALGKPVVEFFDHRPNPRAILDSDGNYCSEYSYMKLSIPAETHEELQRLMYDYFSKKPGAIWQKQKKTARDILKLDDKSSHRAAKIICDLGSYLQPPSHHKQSTNIS